MAYCRNCGSQMEDNSLFCPSCGQATTQQQSEGNASQKQSQGGFEQKVCAVLNTEDTTGDYDAKDIADNKILAVLAYCGPLVFVPLFAAQQSKFARYHANQGLVMFILSAGYGIVYAILGAIFHALFVPKWNIWYGYEPASPLYAVFMVIFGLVWLPIIALMVLGIINAATGKAKELPLIGKIKIVR